MKHIIVSFCNICRSFKALFEYRARNESIQIKCDFNETQKCCSLTQTLHKPTMLIACKWINLVVSNDKSSSTSSELKKKSCINKLTIFLENIIHFDIAITEYLKTTDVLWCMRRIIHHRVWFEDVYCYFLINVHHYVHHTEEPTDEDKTESAKSEPEEGKSMWICEMLCSNVTL